jgi:acid phosphatase (class A)
MKKERRGVLATALQKERIFLLACALFSVTAAAADTGRPGRVSGYLRADAVPSSLAQVPPPPAAGSAAMALDEEIAQRSFSLRGTPRWALAIEDADLSFPRAAGTFTCALEVGITEQDTPHVWKLLQRSARDLGATTRSAKEYYRRQRPFMVNGQPICTPAYTKQLEQDGSYPSGHTTTGWGWALILAELAPERTDALMVRGRAVGESRNVCNVHWHSDVMQGRLIAAGTVARLHAEPEFRADMEAARSEIVAARAKGVAPERDCAAEAAALAVSPSLAQ